MLANFLIVKDGNKKNITIRSGKQANIANLNRAKTVYGRRGIRTLDTTFGSYNGLANRRLQPLGHPSKFRT
jgi:hypothetical protein